MIEEILSSVIIILILLIIIMVCGDTNTVNCVLELNDNVQLDKNTV